MNDLFNQLLDWVSAHTLWAGIAVFLVAFSESVAILGLLIPGVVLMFGFGALIATGALEFWPVFWWAVTGAVAGDGMSFWLGRHFQTQLTGVWPFNRHPQTLQRGVDFFQKYGGKSVAIGRFFGPVRAVIPLVAGMLGMQPWRYVVANLLSALVWAPAYLLPGIVLGASLELASEVTVRLVLVLLILLLSLWLAWLGVHWFYRIIQPYTSYIVQTIFSWGGRHRGLREISQALADSGHPEFKGLTQLASLLILSVLLFVLMAGAIPSDLATSLDGMLYDSLQSLRSPWADELMVHFTRLGDLKVILVFATAVTGALLIRGDRRAVGYWLAAVIFGLLVPVLLTYGLRIPRPDSGVTHLGPWSFPSAHVLRSLTTYGFFSVMIARSIARDWRWISYALVAVIVTAIGLSRLYLGVHWFSDVLGSLLLGLAWISGLGIAYHRHTRPATHPLRLSLGATAVLLLTAGSDAWLHQAETVTKFQPTPQIIHLSESNWLEGESPKLPRYRDDLRGQQNQPQNIQFAGDPSLLSRHLQTQGWRPADMLGWHNLLRLLSPSITLQKLPVLPQVHDGQHEWLVLEKHTTDGGRLVLRLWPTPVRLRHSHQPVWLGNVSAQHKLVLLNLLSYPITDNDSETALAVLRSDLNGLQVHPSSDRDLPLMITASVQQPVP